MRIEENADLSIALEKARDSQEKKSIGILSEKTLHSVLKHYYCGDVSCHEKKYMGCVADIFIEREGRSSLIMEIQTRQTFKLAKKLKIYGDTAEIIIVLPILSDKTVMWVNRSTGEVTRGGKSPRPKNIYTALGELYSLREYIVLPNIKVRVPIIKGLEYRYLSKSENSPKRHTERKDIIPEKIVKTFFLNNADDYRVLVPYAENEAFTASELAKIIRVPIVAARNVILTFLTMGVVREAGKKGREKLWTLC